ncbi:MAG: hypothetical protein QOJ35_1372 [Solirubrobacteraceae bacterium]|jgi:hypothetical protein|nr:hypothetical protein [Solirubrobacteraceae bacterium]
MHTLRLTRAALASGATVTALLALLPATGDAALFTFGSALTAPANVAEARQADTAYWQTTLTGGRSPRSPATGQVKSFKVKGIALSTPRAGVPGGETLFHLQALRKRANGTYKVLRTSQGFKLPHRGTDPQRITTYRPTNFCIAKGDVLALNTVGGWDGIANGAGPYPMGTPLQIFARVPGALVSEFMGAGKTNNGAILRPRTSRGRDHELLMQETVGTGRNGTGLCPGGTGR